MSSINYTESKHTNSKENQIPSISKEKAKKNSETNASFRDLKSTANKKLSTLVNVFDSLSERLRRSIRRPRVLKDANYAALNEIDSAQATPVKLYSPFGIETPSPSAGKMLGPAERSFIRRRFEFSSPTGKLKKDVKEFSEGVNELNMVISTLEHKVENHTQE